MIHRLRPLMLIDIKNFLWFSILFSLSYSWFLLLPLDRLSLNWLWRSLQLHQILLDLDLLRLPDPQISNFPQILLNPVHIITYKFLIRLPIIAQNYITFTAFSHQWPAFPEWYLCQIYETHIMTYCYILVHEMDIPLSQEYTRSEDRIYVWLR